MMQFSKLYKVWCVCVLTAALTLSGCLGAREWTYPPLPEQTYIDVLATDPI